MTGGAVWWVLWGQGIQAQARPGHTGCKVRLCGRACVVCMANTGGGGAATFLPLAAASVGAINAAARRLHCRQWLANTRAGQTMWPPAAFDVMGPTGSYTLDDAVCCAGLRNVQKGRSGSWPAVHSHTGCAPQVMPPQCLWCSEAAASQRVSESVSQPVSQSVSQLHR